MEHPTSDEQTRRCSDAGVLSAVESIVAIAMAEDELDLGDISSQSIVDPAVEFSGALVARQECCAALLGPLAEVIGELDLDIALTDVVGEGAWCQGGDALATVTGRTRDVLAMERTMLNVLSVACATATTTRRFVDAVAGTRAKICETRKTLPGLRTIQKYAVRCGGGHLHRRSLADAVMYKDNHLAGVPLEDLPKVVEVAIGTAREDRTLSFACVEVDGLSQLEQILSIPDGVVDLVLLDNMSPEDLALAVAMRDRSGVSLELEASGGITLETVHTVAASGVDRISVGALTHSAPVVDIALDARQ